MPELLIELFSEEIPARMQRVGAENLKALFCKALEEHRLSYTNAKAFVTPRRLALVVSDIPAASMIRHQERKGPRVGAPEKAVSGFLRSIGLAREMLEERQTDKGKFYFAMSALPSRRTEEIIGEILSTLIKNFPWSKSMRWGSDELRWVRPLQRIVCILSDKGKSKIIPLTIGNLQSGDVTQGHFAHANAPFSVKNAEDYINKLLQKKVILDSEHRAGKILTDAKMLAFANGLELVEDEELLAEITGLVEWPVILTGKIDRAFLDLPAEVLQCSMRTHQKFFSLRNPKNSLIEGFVVVANIDANDGGKTIVAGNQRVLRARLKDAKFFWENDLRIIMTGKPNLGDWYDALENVTFYNVLGTQSARVERIVALSGIIADKLGCARDIAEKAAHLAKVDLCSDMVKEFPELQGIMGRFYAQKIRLKAEIADAIKEHYAPLGPSEAVPQKPASIAVALADKCDLLAGFWSIGEKPTGSKDPFALRRSTLGVIRIILENNITIDLKELLDIAILAHHPTSSSTILEDLLAFIHERLEIFLRTQNVRHDVIRACASVLPSDLARLYACAKAVNLFLDDDSGHDLIQSYRRAVNILVQAEQKDGVFYRYGSEVSLAECDAERAILTALDATRKAVQTALENDNFTHALAVVSALRHPIDDFFEAVKINVENEILRRNRLNLLYEIRALMEQIADFSKIEL